MLTKVLSRVLFKPLPFPAAPIVAPDSADKVAYGRYLVQGRAMCFPCHPADFAKLDELVPEQSAGYLGGCVNTMVRSCSNNSGHLSGVGEPFSYARRG